MSSRNSDLKRSLQPLNVNHLEGRMIRLINKNSSNEILFIGDLSANLEYWWGLIRALGDYGSVTSPDLPGIGGMTSFYKIGRRPSINNYADYLASFVKLRFKRRRLIIVGLGFGFVIATRMLMQYPDIAKRVNLLISLGGYSDHEDFASKRSLKLRYKLVGRLLSFKPSSVFLKHTVYNNRMLKLQYGRRLKSTAAVASKVLLKNEVMRWQSSDLRTFGALMSELSKFTNCTSRVDVPTWHLFVNDRSLIRNRVEQHLKIIFEDITLTRTNKRNLYALKQDKRSAGYFISNELKKLLSSNNLVS